ncbi:hypothetical protein ALC62_08029 [Cyphomyrmex costatus]|uniref:Uncharacterized protein n=1 Tax=Cyphomyrmex costatus TaxID=456900 RepID=A0A195CL51_9HYME|nr:hypothetical protein ALC62_08029 [Cyphomyrmex costatus]
MTTITITTTTTTTNMTTMVIQSNSCVLFRYSLVLFSFTRTVVSSWKANCSITFATAVRHRCLKLSRREGKTKRKEAIYEQ